MTTIVPKGMMLLDGKLVNKPRFWLNDSAKSIDESWACGYKGSRTPHGVGITREAAYEAWVRIVQGPLGAWSKL